jgi:hypothetical protein
MMFFIRTAFWLTLLAVVIPMFSAQPKQTNSQISTVEAFSAANATFSDMKQFCERQQGACHIGEQIMQTLGERAQISVKVVYDYLNEHYGSSAQKTQMVSNLPSQNTLTHDLAIGFQPPQSPKAASGFAATHPRPQPKPEA